MKWFTERLVIWGETYPELSRRYRETVCTGAVRLDQPGLLRIYPLPLRYLPEERRPKKWDIIEARIAKSPSDSRPESFKIDADSIQVVGHIGTENGWERRRQLMLREEHIVEDLDDMKRRQEESGQSLGILRRVKISDVTVRRMSEDLRRSYEAKYEEVLRQTAIWTPGGKPVPVPVFWPRLRFFIGDEERERDYAIRDWEVIQLAKRVETERDPEDAFNEAFFNRMKGREAFVILGNINKNPKTFLCVGLMYPTVQAQPSLF